ncbi:MAG: PTS sugar transporter subunit IIA [Candidatus Aminicenantes bacterium]|nr:PTS sugar transporter subunit IIA [Candidatus Aminicenantes bacterium]
MKKTIKKALSCDNIILNLKSETKQGVIEEMISHLKSCGLLRDKEGALKAVLEREKKMSTGMENGIAIPHGKTDTVDSLIAAVAISRQGVDFECIDGKPARIFIMTISPLSQTGPHIQFLAEVSKLLRNPGARREILNAIKVENVLKVLKR